MRNKKILKWLKWRKWVLKSRECAALIG